MYVSNNLFAKHHIQKMFDNNVQNEDSQSEQMLESNKAISTVRIELFCNRFGGIY